jgi:cobalamin-dependent methionine synthase I
MGLLEETQRIQNQEANVARLRQSLDQLSAAFDAGRIGIEVNEDTGFQYQPEQTTSALICHHPQAKYFVAR